MSNPDTGLVTAKKYGTMSFLALSDLKHEWLLNLCMVLALAAVLTPLLLLLGLKNGVIQTMRERLVQDPVYRELKPQETLNLRPEWFDSISQRPEVAFALPTILRGSSIVRVGTGKQGQFVAMDILPTAPGDALLIDNNGVIPREGEVTLSADAANKLGVEVGSSLTLRVTRSRAGKMETAEAEVKVVSILNSRADAQQRLYAPLSMVTDIEIFREGQGVPARNWPGGVAAPYASFDGVYIIAPGELDSLVTSSLGIGTGFTTVQQVTTEQFMQQTGLTLPPGSAVYDVKVFKEPVQSASVMAIKEKLRGRDVSVLPYATDIRLEVEPQQGSPVTLRLFGLSPSEWDKSQLALPNLPWGSFKEDKPFVEAAQILLPAGIVLTSATESPLSASFVLGDGNKVTFPIKVSGQSITPYAIAPLELVGLLRTAVLREVTYSNEHLSLVLNRTSFSGFRLYAHTIDQVASLHAHLREQGIETITKVQDIERIRTLDKGLTRLFWLVAVVGIVGGIAALVASLYAAVERKKREISMMRLMGLSRFDVSRFPIYQSVMIAGSSALIAILSFYGLAEIINTVFSSDLQFGDGICHLPIATLVQALMITVLVAMISSVFAAWRTTQIEPAEAIRVE